MKKLIQSKMFVIIISCGLSGILISQAMQDDNPFELVVLGYSGDGGLIPGPCPPNVSCTYDYGGYYDMAFKLIYHGENPINITKIELRQKLSTIGGTWINSPRNITPPAFPLTKGDPYYFLAQGVYTFWTVGTLDPQGPFYIKITDSNNETYETSTEAPENIQKFTADHLLSNTHLYDSPWVSVPLIVIILTCTVFARKKVRERK